MKKILFTSLVLTLGLSSCYKLEDFTPGEGLDDWTYATHSGDATPNYTIVFPDNAVNKITITIDADYWKDMQNDLADILSSTSSGGGPGGGGGGGQTFSDETPIYVPCNVEFNGTNWYYVGIRYKGNSTLSGAYSSNIDKLPLRLDFDKFEDDFPEITNQTFYGFNELSLGNNYKDLSFMREKVTNDILREFGLPAVQSSYYRIYIDNGDGNGAVYYGLYTMDEVVFDTHLLNAFGSETGNCYKPDGDAATFADGSFDESELGKKTNELSSDWSDLEALYDIINDGSRTSSPTQWRADLDAIFNTDVFLMWLAANTTFQNWDTYGVMTHNYYLYNDPANGQITWIPWDNNEAFQSSGGSSGPLSFEMTEIGSEWPLITYLLDDAVYKAVYDQHIQDFLDGPFQASSMSQRFQNDYVLLEPYTVGVDGEISGYTFLSSTSDFVNAVSDLNSQVVSRISAADTYLGN